MTDIKQLTFLDDFSILFEYYQGEQFELSDTSIINIQIPMFRAYLQTIEDLLSDEYQKYEKVLERKVKEMTPEDKQAVLTLGIFPPEIDSFTNYVCFQEEIRNTFSNMLKKSLFISLYSYLENWLISLCERHSNEIGQDWIVFLEKQKSSRKTMIVKTIEFLNLASDFNFSTKKNLDWREIDNYRILRNCIVHNASRLVPEPRYKRLKRFIGNNKFLTLTNDEVVLTKEFCESAIHTIESFQKTIWGEILKMEHKRSEEFLRKNLRGNVLYLPSDWH